MTAERSPSDPATAFEMLEGVLLLIRAMRGRRRVGFDPGEAPARTIDLPGRGVVSARRPVDARP